MKPDAPHRLARLLGDPAAAGDWSDADWETLLAQARVASLWPRLGWHFAGEAAPQIPGAVAHHLRSGEKVGASVRDAMGVEIARVADTLASAGLRCVLLKGAAYLAADLPASRGRVFGDIDLLVPHAELSRAERALFGGGWLCQGISTYDSRYYRQWMHEIPPLTHVHRGSVLDLHHTITPPTSSLAVDGRQLLTHARCVDPDRNLWVLQPVDMVLHSAAHLFSEGEFDHGLRDMLDLDDLLRHFAAQDPAFWPALFDRASELGLSRPLHHALQALGFLFGRRLPQAHAHRLARLQPPALQRVLMAWLLRRALKPPHPSCSEPGDRLARWILYVRSHWLRMPVHLLVPHLARKAWIRRFDKQDEAVKAAVAIGPAR